MILYYKNISLKNISANIEGIHYVEEWRPISGYEGCYEISSFGRIKSLARTKINNGRSVPVNEKILKQ